MVYLNNQNFLFVWRLKSWRLVNNSSEHLESQEEGRGQRNNMFSYLVVVKAGTRSYWHM
jgi:hypothetical protein